MEGEGGGQSRKHRQCFLVFFFNPSPGWEGILVGECWCILMNLEEEKVFNRGSFEFFFFFFFWWREYFEG